MFHLYHICFSLGGRVKSFRREVSRYYRALPSVEDVKNFMHPKEDATNVIWIFAIVYGAYTRCPIIFATVYANTILQMNVYLTMFCFCSYSVGRIFSAHISGQYFGESNFSC